MTEARILVVCTANVCRSPIAAALLERSLSQRHVHASVQSAGLLQGGAAASDGSIRAMRSFGVDVSDHRSRRLEPGTMVNVDLVVGMERRHVREAVVLRPEVWPRSFTLRELVRRGDAIGPRRRPETLQAWLARVHLGRSPDAYLSEDRGDDDIADPVGLSNDAYAETATELEGLIERLVDLAWPSQKS